MSRCEYLEPCGLVNLFRKLVVDEGDFQQSGPYAQQEFLAFLTRTLEPGGREKRCFSCCEQCEQSHG